MNEYGIAVFRSRTQTFNFNRILSNKNILCEIINTPREVAIGCGLSVKFELEYLKEVKNLLNVSAFKSFVGFYLVKKDGYNVYVKNKL